MTPNLTENPPPNPPLRTNATLHQKEQKLLSSCWPWSSFIPQAITNENEWQKMGGGGKKQKRPAAAAARETPINVTRPSPIKPKKESHHQRPPKHAALSRPPAARIPLRRRAPRRPPACPRTGWRKSVALSWRNSASNLLDAQLERFPSSWSPRWPCSASWRLRAPWS